MKQSNLQKTKVITNCAVIWFNFRDSLEEWGGTDEEQTEFTRINYTYVTNLYKKKH